MSSADLPRNHFHVRPPDLYGCNFLYGYTVATAYIHNNAGGYREPRLHMMPGANDVFLRRSHDQYDPLPRDILSYGWWRAPMDRLVSSGDIDIFVSHNANACRAVAACFAYWCCETLA